MNRPPPMARQWCQNQSDRTFCTAPCAIGRARTAVWHPSAPPPQPRSCRAARGSKRGHHGSAAAERASSQARFSRAFPVAHGSPEMLSLCFDARSRREPTAGSPENMRDGRLYRQTPSRSRDTDPRTRPRRGKAPCSLMPPHVARAARGSAPRTGSPGDSCAGHISRSANGYGRRRAQSRRAAHRGRARA